MMSWFQSCITLCAVILSAAQLSPPLHQYEQTQQKGGDPSTPSWVPKSHLDACSQQRREVQDSGDLNGIFKLSSCLLGTAAKAQERVAVSTPMQRKKIVDLQREAQHLLLHIVDQRSDLFEARFALGLAFIDTNPLLAHRVFQSIFDSGDGLAAGLSPQRRTQLESVAATAALKTAHRTLARRHAVQALGLDLGIYQNEFAPVLRRGSATTPPVEYFKGSGKFERVMRNLTRQTMSASADHGSEIDSQLRAHLASLKQAITILGKQRVAELLLNLAQAFYLDYEASLANAEPDNSDPTDASSQLLLRSAFRVAADACRVSEDYSCHQFQSVLWMSVDTVASELETPSEMEATFLSETLAELSEAVASGPTYHRRLLPSAFGLDTLVGRNTGSTTLPAASGEAVEIEVLHPARPLVLAVRNFLSNSEADALLSWHKSRLPKIFNKTATSSKADPNAGSLAESHRGYVCFTPTSLLLRKLVPTTLESVKRAARMFLPGTDGRVCVSRGSSLDHHDDHLVSMLRAAGLSAEDAREFLDKVEGGFKGGVSVSAYALAGDNTLVDEYIDLRAQNVFGLHPSHGLPAQFLSYGVHEHQVPESAAGYAAHTDCGLFRKSDFDRTTTLLVYLNDVPVGAGGRTYFPAAATNGSGVYIRPEKGLAIVFRSDTPPMDVNEWEDEDDEYEPEQDLRSGLCDPASLHVAEPLHSHDPPVHKHVVQRWYSRQQLPWVSPKAYSFEQREAVIKHLASKWPAEITDAVDSFDASGVHSKGPVVFCDTSQSCREYY